MAMGLTAPASRSTTLRRHHHMQQHITCRRRRLLLLEAVHSRTTTAVKVAAAAVLRGNLRRSPSAVLSLGRRVPARPVWSGGCGEKIPLPAKRMRLQQLLRNRNDDKDGRGNAK